MPWLIRWPTLVLSLATSLQLLPPAWSFASLTSAEFRLQLIVLGICWLLLASFWVLGRLPAWFSGSLTAALAVVGVVLSAWQFLVAKAAIDDVYRVPPPVGWGFALCLVGLLLMAAAGVVYVIRARDRSGVTW
jgi:hypothetical protein